MIDVGRGAPVTIVPGIQGRWEWMRPAVDALAGTHRVLSFSLTEAPARGDCFGAWVTLVDRVLDRAGVASTALVGVSFGAIVALRYAAERPARVASLVLVSAPAPRWTLDARRAGYLRRPLLSAPAFAARGVRNLLPEVLATRRSWPARAALLGGHLFRVLRYPASPRRMAAWAQAWQTERDEIDCSRIQAPTLIVTGEPHLDRVVPISSTLEYLQLIPQARHAVLAGTGHIGLVGKPEAFARIVGKFVDAHDAGLPGTGRHSGGAARRA